jgi:hypothetical protein
MAMAILYTMEHPQMAPKQMALQWFVRVNKIFKKLWIGKVHYICNLFSYTHSNNTSVDASFKITSQETGSHFILDLYRKHNSDFRITIIQNPLMESMSSSIFPSFLNVI